MRKRHVKNIAYRRLLFSYIVMLIIPVLIGIVSYLQISEITRNGIYQTYGTLMDQMRVVIDGYMSETDSISYQISQNQTLNKLIANGGEGSIQDNIDMEEELKRMKMSNKFIYDCFVYFNDNDTLISSSISTTSQKFFENNFKNSNFDYNSWYDKVLSGYRYKDVVPLSKINNFTVQNSVITYIQSIPQENVSKAPCKLIILLDYDQITNVIKKVDTDNAGTIFILDRNDNVIAATGTGEIPASRVISRVENNSSTFEYKENKKSFIVSYTPSGYNNWNYISIVPKTLFLVKIKRLEVWTLIIFALYFIIGSAIIFFAMRKNYSPIRSILREISKIRGKEVSDSGNEFEIIRRDVIESSVNERQLRSIINKQEGIVKNDFIIKLLKGEADTDEKTLQKLDKMGISFVRGYFAVIIANIENDSEFIEYDSEKLWSLAKVAVGNIMNEIANEKNIACVADVDRRKVALLINISEERKESYDSDVDHILKKLPAVLTEELKIKVSIGISTLHNDISDINDCYNEALVSLDYKIISGGERIIRYSDIAAMEKDGNTSHYYYYPLDAENKIINCIYSGESGEINETLDYIFAENMKNIGITLEQKRCLYYGIVGTYMNALSRLNIDYPDADFHQSDILPKLLEYGSIDILIANLKEMYVRLCDFTQQHKGNRNSEIIDRIEEYIAEKYMDSGLSLNSIAERFAITPQYLSAFFSKNKKEKLIDYIVDVRMQKAEEILGSGKYNVSETAQMVGYTSDAGFIRVFKKYTGVTPGKYRESLNQ